MDMAKAMRARKPNTDTREKVNSAALFAYMVKGPKRKVFNEMSSVTGIKGFARSSLRFNIIKGAVPFLGSNFKKNIFLHKEIRLLTVQ